MFCPLGLFPVVEWKSCFSGRRQLHRTIVFTQILSRYFWRRSENKIPENSEFWWLKFPNEKKLLVIRLYWLFFKHQYFLLVTYIAGSNQKQIRVNYLDCIANISLNIHEQSMKHYIRKFSEVLWNWRQKCAFRHFSSSTQGSVVFINMSAPFCSDSLQSRCFEDKNWISQGQTGHNTYIANGKKNNENQYTIDALA